MSQETVTFRFSLWRLLVLTAMAGVWFGSLRVLPFAWIAWLTTALFYLGVVLCFSPGKSQR